MTRQGIKQNIKNNTSYFITPTVIGWIDIFTRREIRDIVIESLRYCHYHKGLNVYGYCIMSNHLHLIVNCNEPFQLRDTIRDFKRHTSSTIFQWIMGNPESRRDWMTGLFTGAANEDIKSKNIKIWQTGNHAIELINEQFTWRKVLYIHDNPVRAGLVSNPEDWIYSSARNYIEKEAVFEEVSCLPPPLNFKK
ncbi:transposase [Cryomorpha ignava]|uniref:Transposase n=1 Tax=Cryomorpha ignava TaxID=101383 RepID=A0A7K3WT95_9FLAO|nr:transposase [Cryomorpha ignava]NEN24686.1 transposase [Cryomorpha ignava]